jgi:3-deoxy-D-manno-octulosonate 8-phosphate phosphatase (KDO 8-P phosphatase)
LPGLFLLSFAVPGAVDDARRYADVITTKDGGNGAVRQVCEVLLRAQGLWEEVTSRYFYG